MDKYSKKKGFCAYYLGGLFVRMSDNNLFLLCGGLAFATLLCLVPLVFLIFFALEAILDVRAIAHLINQAVDVLIPYPRQTTYLKEALSSRVSGVMTFKEVYGISGFVDFDSKRQQSVQQHEDPAQRGLQDRTQFGAEKG